MTPPDSDPPGMVKFGPRGRKSGFPDPENRFPGSENDPKRGFNESIGVLAKIYERFRRDWSEKFELSDRNFDFRAPVLKNFCFFFRFSEK